MNFDLTPQNIIIAIGIFTGIAVVLGIYKLATAHLHEKSILKPGTAASNSNQAFKAIIVIFLSILIFLALFVTWQIFTHQNELPH